jgi:hypothetical protein
MLRDEGVVFQGSWGERERERVGGSNQMHEEIDRELRRIAKRKAGLEVDEARWLREAEAHRIWRKLGFSTALEYLEDVFGYAPRTAKDRLRVARELGELPQLEAELRRGALSYSAARELSRVMTRDTEDAWLACARGRNVHDIQRLVEGHRKGDAPDAPKDPALITRTFVFELDGRRAALLEQVRSMFEHEQGEHLDNPQLMEAMCMRLLAVGAANDCNVEETTDGSTTTLAKPARAKAARPAHQIVIRRCDECFRAWQQGRGSLVPITAKDLALVSCDAEIVREVELLAAEEAGRRRPRPTLTIPAKIRDLVMARDEGKCRFPGCRATRHVAIHHIEFRSDGGDHDPANLISLCDGHHKLLHEGIVSISGRAPDQLVFTRNGEVVDDSRAPAALSTVRSLPRRETSSFDDVVTREHATQALEQLGYKTREAKRAIDDARARVGTTADVVNLVRMALARGRAGASLSAAARTDDSPCGSETVSLAKQALVQLGFDRATAERAVSTSRAHVGTDGPLDVFIKDALRHC